MRRQAVRERKEIYHQNSQTNRQLHTEVKMNTISRLPIRSLPPKKERKKKVCFANGINKNNAFSQERCSNNNKTS